MVSFLDSRWNTFNS